MTTSTITLQTNQGQIVIALDTKNTPKTAENFLNYAKNGFYEGTIFHRVIDGFMIQGGGFNQEMVQKKVNPPIQHEGSAAKDNKNKRGTVAMARTSDPHSATAQFFINVVDNAFLDHKSETPNGWGYCVFANVIDGMDVVDKIKKVPTTTRGGHQDVPVEPIIVEKVLIGEVENTSCSTT
ncbi:MAG TPA: peptidylprolyl isomerase [Gammaproteobacteria bacterium]|jgi:peptidyl-prolyl cis-trans isomerase B (cyclophilin B)|nr:peptidylprolyl isomerase [Gammaproteobacteria bacterium]